MGASLDHMAPTISSRLRSIALAQTLAPFYVAAAPAGIEKVLFLDNALCIGAWPPQPQMAQGVQAANPIALLEDFVAPCSV